ncbi:MAG: nitroreductase family protein [Planctomycetota bacterium]
MNRRRNPVEHDVIVPVQERWSPYRFDGREVAQDQLNQCLEAARWAASSFNDQPWSFLIARRESTSEFESMLGCLLEANQGWASRAGVLILTCVRTSFEYNGKPNRVALHDLGQAACQLSLQAASLGLQVHQMAGVNLSLIRQRYSIPDGVEPQTAIAIGHPDLAEPADELGQQLAKRETGPRSRKPLAEICFSRKFGDPAELG